MVRNNINNNMTLLQHLSELRLRIVYCVISIFIFSTISLFFAENMILLLAKPYGGLLQVIEPTEGFAVYLRIGLTGGIALSLPILIYQMIAFVSPGLTSREKKMMIFVLPASLILFAIGGAFAWFIMTPAAIEFLSQFMSNIFVVNWTSRAFVRFVLSITFWIGIAFEMPLILMFLAWLGMVTPMSLLRGWRIAVVIIAVVSALITPTVDPFNMILVMAPLICLYLLSVLLSVFPFRARQRRMV